jgi:hypothetical protein
MDPIIKGTAVEDREKSCQEPASAKGEHLGGWQRPVHKHGQPAVAARWPLSSSSSFIFVVTPWTYVKWLFLVIVMFAMAVAMWYSITLTGMYCPSPFSATIYMGQKYTNVMPILQLYSPFCYITWVLRAPSKLVSRTSAFLGGSLSLTYFSCSIRLSTTTTWFHKTPRMASRPNAADGRWPCWPRARLLSFCSG